MVAMAASPIMLTKRNGLRLVMTVVPIALAMTVTALLLFVYPPVKDAVQEGIQLGGPWFKWLVLPPAIVMAVVTTVLAFRILWNASETNYLDERGGD